METKLSLFFFCVVIISSTAEPVENIRVLVGGNITLREPVNEEGILTHKGELIAQVFNGKMKIRKERFNKKLMWDNRTRFFTITNIQKNDSGTYDIDNEKSEIRIFILSVYEPLPPPSVRRSNEDPTLCSLLCYVDGAPPLTSVVWMKGQEVMNQSSSYSSVLLTIPEQDLTSSLTCAAQSPAENKTVEVEVTTWCGDNNKDNNNNNNRHRLLLILIIVSVCAVVVLIVCVITGKCFKWKRKHTQETMTSEPDLTYAEVHISSHSEGPVSSPDVSTVYSKIQLRSRADDDVLEET
ncbi:CD48 antigen-like isoform X2 [Gouania willdenowi]|uniref:CD48 antigen-like isoform X2 n=1 Tax=Gouania willdenowi TaxID=441366 RepID=UPI0010551FC3|nr:CD48 antigen-like isoform X2 [Gouania willdenowi]